MPTLACTRCDTTINAGWLYDGEPCVQSDCNGLLHADDDGPLTIEGSGGVYDVMRGREPVATIHQWQLFRSGSGGIYRFARALPKIGHVVVYREGFGEYQWHVSSLINDDMTPLNSIAWQIRCWRVDVALMESSSGLRSMLCFAYNWANSPTRLMTDREHKACRRFQRWCRIRLDKFSGWQESENGKLFC